MKAISSGFIFVLWIFFVAQESNAALFIDDTYTTEKGHTVLEFCLDYYKDKGREFDAGLYLSYGLTGRWDIGITLPYKFLDNSQIKVEGFSDLVVETKYRFCEETDYLPSYALYLDLKTDSANADKGLGTGEKEYSINNIFTKNIGDDVFDLNLGYVFLSCGSDDIFFYSLDVARDLSEKLNLCLEIYGETVFKGDFGENIFVAAASFSYEVSERLSLESGIGFGISEASPDYQATNKITLNF